MQVLSVGYGKIGRIKASIWKQLGASIIVQDPSPTATDRAIQDGFAIYKSGEILDRDLVIDISSPAGHHEESLRWVLDNDLNPTTILLEKPMASTAPEIQAFRDLFATSKGSAIHDRILINESYLLSQALVVLNDKLRENNETITSVLVDLSKDRLPDVRAGRFTDPALGPFGIELPHMIAVFQALGFSLEKIKIETVTLFKKSNHPQNSGLRVRLSSSGVPIVLDSFLGDFKVTQQNMPFAANDIERSLRVVTNSNVYEVEFDPVAGLDRYVAKLAIKNSTGQVLDQQNIPDNHLRKQLSDIFNHHSTSALHQLMRPNSALKACELLLNLKDQAVTETLPSTFSSSSRKA